MNFSCSSYPWCGQSLRTHSTRGQIQQFHEKYCCFLHSSAFMPFSSFKHSVNYIHNSFKKIRHQKNSQIVWNSSLLGQGKHPKNCVTHKKTSLEIKCTHLAELWCLLVLLGNEWMANEILSTFFSCVQYI